ncbi:MULTISPECIES: DNA double-strand break repair nuclease NurA [Cyanophyceae]|uniref:DNA double-strand break repair nuclease NurA n=1 Tax=Cyanophyceae TaxID=3028117 RepID=UPI00168456E5|nr:DNA double-strand break repair nuclease NurA [Trichocoleus sp. FACHB-69]MBD1930611.1 DNA double-strand break repair nuclease NurA [Trichocoleus sp. FACHB-69]
MLDLTKLARQMQGISQHLTLEAAASRQRLERAQQFFILAKTQQAELVQRQEKWRDRITFNAATPVEPLSTCIDLPIPPACHTVIATDGSQIAPNHHEIAYCYLINVGRVMLHYGQSLHPLLDSLPEVFYQPEDLYVSRQWGIRTEEWMGYRRTASETSVLAELACNWVNQREVDKGKKMLSALSPVPNPQSPVPTLAMVDGSLIYWFLEQLPGEARDRILPPILEAWDALREAGIPIMGYLSASRSSDSLNFLRLPACPHPAPDCMTHCPGQSDRAPCQVFDPLRDTFLWASQLQPGQRSTLWRSSARILDLYGAHQIYFCYVHVGTEIARVEVPAWVAENPEKLDSALSLMLAQVQKGYGYPVALAEAHNQAVVRGGDRARFFALLEQQMIKAGLRNVGTSYKEARKRGSIA